MTIEEHARPGDLIPSLALDAALPLYERLGLDHPDLPAPDAHRAVKEALEWGKFPEFHGPLWDCLKAYAQTTLPERAGNVLLSWYWNAYTGYYAANPDMAIWIDAITTLHAQPQYLSELGIMPEPRKSLVAFVEAVMTREDYLGFSALLDEQRDALPTSWDRRMLARYGMVFHDKEGGTDPFIILKMADAGQAVRQTLVEMPPLMTPYFPIAELDKWAWEFAQTRGGWMPPGRSLTSIAAMA